MRTVIGQHSGSQHGPITRLIDPGGIGEALKPFVFLDFFKSEVTPGFGFGMHPHSGIATLTWQPGSDINYEDTTGQRGVLKAGGLEWMNAGGAAWHRGSFVTAGMALGFQLWVALPPGVEDGDSAGLCLPPEAVPQAVGEPGVATLFLGELEFGATRLVSPIRSYRGVVPGSGDGGSGVPGSTPPAAVPDLLQQRINYFVVTLKPGSSWCYQPPPSHDVAWAFVFEGGGKVAGDEVRGLLLEMAGEGGIELVSGPQGAKVLLGSAQRHRFDLVLGPSSVHTNPDSLRRSRERIRAMGQQLQLQGRLGN